MIGRLPTTLLLLLLAGCGREADDAPLQVDVIAGSSAAGQIVAVNTVQGLVALDEEGEVTPALARRWTVLEDGSFIFRLDDHRWDDGSALTADRIARTLREARRERGILAPLLADIDEINAVTPRILELSFTRRRPDLLRLLALPELGVTRGGETLGPLAIADGYAPDGERLLLVRRISPPDPDAEEEAEPIEAPGPEDTIELRFTRPALAVARFRRGESALVLGGDWTTLPYAQAIEPQNALQLDPTEGLFGLGFVEESGFLADARNRQLLSLAVNRALIVDALARPEAVARAAIVPNEADGLASAVVPPWQEASLDARRGFAREAVGRWEAENGEIPPLRVALPDTAGSRLLFAILAAGWQAIGVEAVRVGLEADADLRLIDRVAPTSRADWYLQFFRCAAPFPCSEAYAQALEALGEAETPRVRAIRAADAARELESMAPFIPLLRPIRWSLVGPGIAGFAPNRYASHPLAPILAARR